MTTVRSQSKTVARHPLAAAPIAIDQPDGHAERLRQHGQIVGEFIGQPDQFGTGEQADVFGPAAEQMRLLAASQRTAVRGRLQAHLLMIRQVSAVVALSTDNPRIDGDAISHFQRGCAKHAAAIESVAADAFDDRSKFVAGDDGETQRGRRPLMPSKSVPQTPVRWTASKIASSAISGIG